MPPSASHRNSSYVISVDILAGFVITPEGMTVANLSAEAKKFMVVMNAATSIITTKSPYITRSSLTVAAELRACSEPGPSRMASRKVYTMVSDYAPGHDAEASFVRAFKAAGGEIAGSVRMPIANPDFSAFVQRAKDFDPDGIFVFVPGGSQPPALGKALIERGMDPGKIKIMGQGELPTMARSGPWAIPRSESSRALHYDYTHDRELNREFVKSLTPSSGAIRISTLLADMTAWV